MRTVHHFLYATILFSWTFSAHAGDLGWYRWEGDERIQFGGFVYGMNAIQIIDSDEGADRRVVYGDRFGSVRVLRLKKEGFREEWVSDPLRSAIAQVFVEDIDRDGKLEIMAYTEVGDIAIYKADDYKVVWQIERDEYDGISSMLVENVDEDPQLELVFSASKVVDVENFQTLGAGTREQQERAREIAASRLFIFDCLNLFVEWESELGLFAQRMVTGDLDADGNLELALNTGFVVDLNYRSVEWSFPEGFGLEIGYADIDGDGIPELIGESQSPVPPRRFLRFFDVDLQAENFLFSRR